MSSDCEQFDSEHRAVARPIVTSPKRLHAGAAWAVRCRTACVSAAAAAVAAMLWLGAGSFGGPAEGELLVQPAARPRTIASSRMLPGLASDSLGKSASDVPSKSRASRAERRKARQEAARAKRIAARELRASTAQERREARKAKRAAAKERRAAAREARREAVESRREEKKIERAAVKARYAAVVDTRRESAAERRAAAKDEREAARERRRQARQARLDAKKARREAKREQYELARARREPAVTEELREEPILASTSAGSVWSASVDPAAASGPGNTGTLRITSLPWAQVFVDGRMVGYTPQRGIRLTPGEHAVQLVNPEFNMRKTLQVQIARGEEVTRRELLEE